MEKKAKIAFLGGDLRQRTAAVKLADSVWNVFVWGQEAQEEKRITSCDSVSEAINGAAAVILPLPASTDGIMLNSPALDEGERISLKLIADMLDKKTLIIGGKLPGSFVEYSASKGIQSFDYFLSEAFQIKNAYTTAEAALNIAMNSLKKNIRGARTAVTGYGRISKQLVALLRRLGAEVTVAARKESDLALAELEGCSTLNIGVRDARRIDKLCSGYDIIFNTVPSWLFDESFLAKADRKTLIIDLASSPGGVDVSAAKRFKSNVLWAASLPGKYAPDSAGEIIADCVDKILQSEVIL